jgi:hypothetical protein
MFFLRVIRDLVLDICREDKYVTGSIRIFAIFVVYVALAFQNDHDFFSVLVVMPIKSLTGG